MDWAKLTESEMAEFDGIEQRFRALDHSDPREVAELSALLTGGEAFYVRKGVSGWNVSESQWVILTAPLEGGGVAYHTQWERPILAEDQLHRLVAEARRQLGWYALHVTGRDEAVMLAYVRHRGGRQGLDAPVTTEPCSTESGALGLAWWRSKQSGD